MNTSVIPEDTGDHLAMRGSQQWLNFVQEGGGCHVKVSRVVSTRVAQVGHDLLKGIYLWTIEDILFYKPIK